MNLSCSIAYLGDLWVYVLQCIDEGQGGVGQDEALETKRAEGAHLCLEVAVFLVVHSDRLSEGVKGDQEGNKFLHLLWISNIYSIN